MKFLRLKAVQYLNDFSSYKNVVRKTIHSFARLISNINRFKKIMKIIFP